MTDSEILPVHVDGSISIQLLRHLSKGIGQRWTQSNWVRLPQPVITVATALTVVMIISACSASPEASEEPTATTATTPEPAEDSAVEDPTADDSAEPIEEASDEIVIRPAPNDGAETGDQSWIGTGEMTDDSIQLVWDLASQPNDTETSDTETSDTETSDTETSEMLLDTRIYRIPTAELSAAGWDSPEQAVLTGEHLLYEIPRDATTYTDSQIETGLFYTYFLIGLADRTDQDAEPEVVIRRWTTGLARTDTEPPTAIEGLAAEVTSDGVLLTWEPSTDNVEFASYSVSLVGADGANTYLGGGADVSLVSFLDDRPEGETVTYLVEAVDFHNNRGQSATVTVNIP